MTIQISDESEDDYEDIDYSLSPFVNMSSIKKQAQYGYKHATVRANSIDEEMVFPQKKYLIGRKTQRDKIQLATILSKLRSINEFELPKE